MKKSEAIPKGWWRASMHAKIYMKKLVRRQRRRSESKDPENVPTKFIYGWYW